MLLAVPAAVFAEGCEIPESDVEVADLKADFMDRERRFELQLISRFVLPD